jgi:ATP-dependent DNA helicase RecG
VRPALLFPLFKPLQSLPGVGPRVGALLEKLCGPHVIDVLWHRPTGIIDRRHQPAVRDIEAGRVVTVTVTVDGHIAPPSKRQPYRVRCSDATGPLDLTFFHARGDWVAKQLPIGAQRVVSGRAELYHGIAQIAHPDLIADPASFDAEAAIEPVYPMTAGLHPRVLRKLILAGLDGCPQLPEWLDGAQLAREAWPSWAEALRLLHNPLSEADLEPTGIARQRLAYDELLSNQLALSLIRAAQRRPRGRSRRGDGHLRQQVLAALPFTLTGAQTRTLAEIDADLADEGRMLRLLQGDVGSGKTVVALLAMLTAVETGSQAALMAPTEVLARQHFETIAPLLDFTGCKLALLTGRDKGKARDETIARLADGDINIVLGTHALFQDDVAFRDLGLVVIDEQHRFGVNQRLRLSDKGQGVDVLVMTATPIPRTLTLTAYGDMDVSRLDEKPPGRRPVTTAVLPVGRLHEILESLPRQIDRGARIYWICPLVEESEAVDLAAATDRHAQLRELFGDRVGLVHGRMKASEKDAAMAAFKNGAIDILVATTVVEVGVNVPEATVMIIEHAERFGLAQLHQLRGRVGRGLAESTCLLIYDQPLGEVAKARLRIMRETEDGFVIAEEDLRLRGAGDVLGTKQAGLPDFRVADLDAHGELLAMARDDAKLILDRDPQLTSARGQALRVLLYLFERDAAVRNLRSG